MAGVVVNASFLETLCPCVSVIDNTKMVATETVKAGTTIYVGECMFSYGDELLVSLLNSSEKEIDQLETLVLDLYPRTTEERLRFLSIRVPEIDGRRMVSSVVYKIEFAATANKYSSGDGFVVYNMGSKLNHSCYPNCLDVIDRESNVLTIMAARDILPGEECTVSYNHALADVQNRKERREILRRDLYFECECRYCAENVPLPGIEALYMGCIGTGRVVPCSFCNIVNITKRCGKCKKVSYCNRVCQLKHWPKHKKECK